MNLKQTPDNMKETMTLKQRLNAIKELETFKAPFEIMRVFGNMTVYGSNVCFGDNNDFVTEAELKQAVEVLVEQLEGTVKWKKDSK